MRTFIYIVWTLVAITFVLCFLWALLESRGSKKARTDTGDLGRQSLFVLAAVLISVAIDTYLLPGIYESTLEGTGIPLWILEIFLLPAILMAGAYFIGPSKKIRITKAPRPTERKRK